MIQLRPCGPPNARSKRPVLRRLAAVLTGASLGAVAELLLLAPAVADDGAEFAGFESRARESRPDVVPTHLPALPWPTEAAAPRRPLAAERAVLTLAAAADWPAVLASVKAGRAPATTMDAEGHTLLALAAAAGQTELVRTLIARGAEIDRRAPEGLSPLQLAVTGGHADVVRVLLKAGADTWRRGGAELPPLHHAARLGDLAVLRVLLDGGADPLHTDAEGRTALAVARFARQAEARSLLGPPTEDARQRLANLEAGPVRPLPFRR